MLHRLSSYFAFVPRYTVFTNYLRLSVVCCSLFGCDPKAVSNESCNPIERYSIDHHLQLSIAYLEAGYPVMARKQLLEAEKHSPNDFHVQSMLAYCFTKAGEWQKAEKYYLKALNNAKNGVAHNNYGCFLCERGQYQQAEAHFLKAIEDTNYVNSGSAYENAGLCAMRALDTTKAIGYLKQAIQHNPRLEKSRLALSQLYKNHTLTS